MQIPTASFEHSANDVVSIYNVADCISCLLDDSHACQVSRNDDKSFSLSVTKNGTEIHSKINSELVGTVFERLCPTSVTVRLPEQGDFCNMVVEVLVAYDSNWKMPYLPNDETSRIVKWAQKKDHQNLFWKGFDEM